MRRVLFPALILLASLVPAAMGQGPGQPKVAPGPDEPDLSVVLDRLFGLSMFGDLANPVRVSAGSTPGLFRTAGPGPVVYQPVVALGLETVNRGGWYRPGADAARPDRVELWSYRFKHTTAQIESGLVLPPEPAVGSRIVFDPGDAPFGLWVANDGLAESDVYTQPKVVAARNKRLARQPYKAMIYPFKDRATGKVVPNSYLIGWEYSTNDDFQDVVCRVDNVHLVDGP